MKWLVKVVFLRIYGCKDLVVFLGNAIYNQSHWCISHLGELVSWLLERAEGTGWVRPCRVSQQYVEKLVLIPKAKSSYLAGDVTRVKQSYRWPESLSFKGLILGSSVDFLTDNLLSPLKRKVMSFWTKDTCWNRVSSCVTTH
jgi:hypothetical protein